MQHGQKGLSRDSAAALAVRRVKEIEPQLPGAVPCAKMAGHSGRAWFGFPLWATPSSDVDILERGDGAVPDDTRHHLRFRRVDPGH